jgi:hypothetical protein
MNSMHRLAAVDIDGLAGHEIARRGGQEHHGADQVGGKLRALDGAAGGARGEMIADEVATCVSLSVMPGVTALTVMPNSPTSRASARVKPMTPAFDVV